MHCSRVNVNELLSFSCGLHIGIICPMVPLVNEVGKGV